jgi:HlyD family secretion protein
MSALISPSPARAPQTPAPIIVPSPPHRSRRWVLLVAAIILIVGGIAAYRMLSTKPQAAPVVSPAIRTTKAFTGPLDVTVRVAGTTSARNFVNVTAPLLRGPEMRNTLVLLELADAGAFVRKGQVVARLDAQQLRDHIVDVRDMVAAAEMEIRKREANHKVDWENLQQTLRVTKAAFDKASLDFSAAEVRTEVERELMRIARDEARARYEQQQKDLAFRQASQAADMRILQIALLRQQRHLNNHLIDLETFTIRAPMDGLVVMSSIRRSGEIAQVQAGDQVMPRQPIMKIVDPRSMQVEASVSQAYSTELRLNQPVHVGLDAFGDVELKGKLYSIGALAVGGWRQNDYIRNVPVRIAINATDPRLIPDLSAHCDIVLETVPNQRQIPLAAVQSRDGKNFVSVKKAQQFETREVTLGKRNSIHVAVLSGLQDGEEVRLF